jgi:hypothetical protein
VRPRGEGPISSGFTPGPIGAIMGDAQGYNDARTTGGLSGLGYKLIEHYCSIVAHDAEARRIMDCLVDPRRRGMQRVCGSLRVIRPPTIDDLTRGVHFYGKRPQIGPP